MREQSPITKNISIIIGKKNRFFVNNYWLSSGKFRGIMSTMKPLLSSLSILIPAYNDAQTIESLVFESISQGEKVASDVEIVVINDASSDNTRKILDSLGKKYSQVVVKHHTRNQGYGGTIKELYYVGRSEWIFTLPGDFQIEPKEMIKLIPFTKEADMIIGWRNDRHDPPERLRQSRIYNTILQLLFGIRLHDVNSVRLMKRSMMQHIRLLTQSAFVDAELAIHARDMGFRIVEVPIEHKKRETMGAGGGSLKTILPTIQDMFAFRLGLIT